MDIEVSTKTNTLTERIRQAFEALQQGLKGKVAGPIHARRLEALARFERAGLPTPKTEAYRYTPLAPVLHGGLAPAPFTKATLHPFLPWLRTSFVVRERCNVLTTVNGRYEAAASTILSPIHEVELTGAADAERKNSRTHERHFGTLSERGGSVADLNTALATNGSIVRVPEGKKVELPVVLYHMAEGIVGSPLSQPRTLVVLGDGAELELIEVHDASGGYETTANAVTEIVLGKGARLHYTKIQQGTAKSSLIDSTFLQLAEGAWAHTVTLCPSGKLTRNNLHIDLAGPGAWAGLYGLAMLQAGRHVDNYTEVRHLVPDCESEELYKTAAAGKSVGVFNGKIYVAQDAQRTNAFQSNRNLLLDDEAVVYTKPQLEIFADDVRCTHGATIGQLDDEALFYLRSRGIGEAEARTLLLEAFAGEVLGKIHNPAVRAYAQGVM